MPLENGSDIRTIETARPDEEEGLLIPKSSDEYNDDGDAHQAREPSRPPPLLVEGLSDQGSYSTEDRLSKDAQPETPHTANRVRFDLGDGSDAEDNAENGFGPSRHGRRPAWLEDDDYMHDGPDEPRRSSSSSQQVPLLTNIEAPSVTVATSSDFFPEEHLESARPRSGIINSFMNMANSIVGAGIVGQPYAFRQAGMLMGIILLVGLTCTVDWTIQLIVINSKLSGADSFQSTVEFCFGRPGLIAISVAQWAFAFGGMVAFCIIVGDTIPRVLSDVFPTLKDMPFLWLLTDRRAIIVLFVLGVSYPLSLYRDIAKLAKASTFALVSMVLIVVTVITQGVRVDSDLKGNVKELAFVNSGFFQAVGVISFAFVCHHNSLLIYGSLKKPTMDRFAAVTHYSTGISLALCLTMALAGFITFGDKIKGNVLNNFPPGNVMVNIARLCFGLNMLTTLPLEAFVCRSVMTTFYFPDEPYNLNRHLIFTTALVVSSMALGLITCDLGIVFELIGATSACALAYILPPLCYVKLSRQGWKSKIPAYVCIAFGVVVMCITIIQAIVHSFKNEGGAKTC